MFSMQISVAMLIIILAIPLTEASLKSLYNKVKQLKNKFRNHAEVMFADRTELEYPGDDQDMLTKIRQLWTDYYDCLNLQNSNLGVHRSVLPEAVMAYEGGSVSFQSKVCLSPMDAENMAAVTWYFAGSTSEPLEPVEPGEHKLMSPTDKTLKMYNLQREDGGQYFAMIGDTVTAPYFLQVVDEKEPVALVHPNTAPRAMHAMNEEIIPPLRVFTSWQQWSPCNRCGKVGKRMRHGVCTVVLVEPSNTETTSLLNLFKNGLPCRSPLLPADVATLTIVRDRKSELMVGFCKPACPPPVVFEVLDESGTVIETANNSAGIYSTLQGVPSVPPPIARSSVFETSDRPRLILKCPGNLNSDVPVMWQIGGFTVNPELMKKESRGRMYVNLQEYLVIKKPRVTDSNIYSCWQASELAGTIRLTVVKKMRLSFNHHIMILGMFLIMATFLLVCYRAFRGRTNQLAR